jgi:NAD(P)-dependent dehydrogenase (short-subunit alcohol dehydrogenase family)
LHAALIEQIRAKSVHWIRLGNQNRQLASDRWEIDMTDRAAFDFCLSRLERADLVYFTGGIGCELAGDEVERVEQAQKYGPIALARFLQALDRQGWMESPPIIRVISAGVYPIRDESGLPYGAGLTGLAGSLAKESPRLNIACLDLDPDEIRNAEKARELALSVACEPSQRSSEKISLRNGKRWRLQLRLTEIPLVETSRFRDGGVYLILGGAGRIGLRLSVYLATKFHAKLVWVGRRPFDSRIEADAEQIRSAGGEVLYLQARGDDLGEMGGVFDAALHRFGRLNGVIHSTLVFQDELLRDLDEDLGREILNSKIKTTAILAELTRALPLDFLLFLGSAQSFFNEARRGAYAAGCCFVDAYARLIQQQAKFPVHVINWGFWGHSSDGEIQRAMKSAGLGVIHPQDGMDAIERTLAAGFLQIGFLKASSEALLRMGIDLSEQLLYLPESEDAWDELETVFAEKFSQ